MKFSNLPFKAESELVRAWYRFTQGRPSSDPYISGDGFRSLAEWYYEEETASSFDASCVGSNSLGYCDGWLLESFLEKIGPQIQVPFSMISHNADPNFGQERLAGLPMTLVRLLTMNCLVDDPRVIALPIGLENARFHYNGVVSDFNRLRAVKTIKKPRILSAFTVGTNPKVRGAALAALETLSTVDRLDRINSRSYRKIASGYAFVASPPGNGEDCHRTWESLYLRTVPIVLRSPLTERFVQLGLPVWVVDRYEDLAGFDSPMLERRYTEISRGFENPWLWMDAWKTLVRKGQP